MIDKDPAVKGRSYRFPVRRLPLSGLLLGGLLLSGLLSACAGLPEGTEPLPEMPAVSEGEYRPAVPAYDERDHPLPGKLRFIPAPVPQLRLPPGLGTLRRDPDEPDDPLRKAELRALEGSFKTAYIEALLRDTPLAGVLGGDLVHEWPPENPIAWVQNWRSTEPQPNSWGLPSLVLALRGIQGDRVFVVTGPILDAYGRGEGLKGANGAAGYGAPRGDPFPLGRGQAQRFDLGLFMPEPPDKTVFIPGEAPSAVLPCPPQTGSFPEGSPEERERIGEAFRSAWRTAVDAQYLPPSPSAATSPATPDPAAGGPVVPGGIPSLRPDGAVVYCPLKAVPRAGPGEEIPRGVYIQSFEGASLIFLLADSPALPSRVRVIRPPFTEALLAPGLLPGAETLATAESGDPREDGMTWLGALLRGLARYGIPLTDEVPRYGDGLYRPAQRFSRGWMILEESD